MGRTNVRATGLVFKEEQILLIHRFKFGSEYWTIPGGAVEDGETIEEALVREMNEEIGIHVTHFQKSFEQNYSNPSPSSGHFFICDIGRQTPKLGDGPESLANSPDNQYIPTWVDVYSLPSLTLYPPVAQQVITTYETYKKSN